MLFDDGTYFRKVMSDMLWRDQLRKANEDAQRHWDRMWTRNMLFMLGEQQVLHFSWYKRLWMWFKRLWRRMKR